MTAGCAFYSDVSLSDPRRRRAERRATVVSDVRLACASMSAKPCPAYAIRVRHNEVRSGAGGIRSAHLTAFCSPRQRRLCSSVPFGGSCLSSAHPTTECGFESQRVKRQALCSLARPSGVQVGVSVPVSVNSDRRHADGEHGAAPVCSSACERGRRCLASTALRGFLSNTSPTKVRHLRVCSVRVEAQPGAARFFVVSIALRMRLRSSSLALALPQQSVSVLG